WVARPYRATIFSSHFWFFGHSPVQFLLTGSPQGLAMRVPSHPTLIRRMLNRRLKQLAPAGPLLAASLTQVNKHCGQPSCSCHHGGPLHPAHHLTLKQGGKTRTVYVP